MKIIIKHEVTTHMKELSKVNIEHSRDNEELSAGKV